MIKCELTITDSEIQLGKHTLRSDYSHNWVVLIGDKFIGVFETIEQAIKYCLENRND